MFLAGTTVWEGLGSGALRRAVFLVLGLKVSKPRPFPMTHSLSASQSWTNSLAGGAETKRKWVLKGSFKLKVWVNQM